MTKNLTDMVLTPEDQEKVRVTANQLMEASIEGTSTPMHAIGALMLAAGSAAAYGRLDYKSMVDLISMYYEGVLVADAQKELARAEGHPTPDFVLPKPAGLH